MLAACSVQGHTLMSRNAGVTEVSLAPRGSQSFLGADKFIAAFGASCAMPGAGVMEREP